MAESTSKAASAAVRTRLRQVLRDEVDGKRTCVLVLGDGVNVQASGARRRKVVNEWQRMLTAVWCDAGGAPGDFNAQGQSPSAICSALIRQWSAHHSRKRLHSRREVQARMCAYFEKDEAGAATRRKLYSSLLDGRFANLVSLSVDRRLVLHAGASRVINRRGRESFLYRHFDVTGPRGLTKVWFPYGDTSRPASIELDSSTYDERLRVMEESRARLMEEYNKWDYGFGPGLLSPTSVYDDIWSSPSSWCDLFFCAPLVFVGASLPADDWPLWWLLHQRARYFVPFGRQELPETFYLTPRNAETVHIQNRAAGLEMVTFRNHDSMWKFIQDALDAKKVDLRAWRGRKYRPRQARR